ncbi:MAG: exo-alpha-sialidase, partial [Chloroflexi bacterium]|nr:exo-alpha-sialidase [Chloroflexota bacterium]
VGEDGRLHLIYIHSGESEELVPGLFYRVSDDQGNSWSDPVLLYESSYYRNATDFNSHIKIETAGESKVFVAWDNRTLDTVFVMRSPDGGETWTEPLDVDHREPEDPAEGAGPSNIDLHIVDEDEIHLSWWAGDEEDALTCLVHHQWSENGGAAWTEPEVVFEDSRDCPIGSDFIIGNNGVFLFMTLIREEAYFQAWDRESWTDPEPQDPLSKFQDPNTFRDVLLGCQQMFVTPDDELIVVGCGSGNDRDVWMQKRPLGGQEDWFTLLQATPVWSAPASLIKSTVHILPAQVVAGADDRLHAFWSQSNDRVAFSRIDQVSTEVGADIYYARLNAGQWSAPRPVLSSPMGKADQIAVASGRRDSLFIVWSSGKDGGIYFSRAKADNASSETEWIDPVLLPAPQTTGSWPDILVDEEGIIYVAYTIPLNEDRGIYLIRSRDNGDTWSEPLKVFDGLENGWQNVGRPQLTWTLGDNMHMVWTRDVPTSNSTLAMVYARSEDNGATWSEPELVTEETVVWSDVLGVGDRTVHRAWLGLSDSRTLLWHQVSFDNGLTWSDTNRVSDPSTESGPTSLVLDTNRTPHLLQLAETNEAELLLQEWIWDGERWQKGDPLDLGLYAVGADALTAVQAPDGNLGVIYGTLLMDEDTAEPEDYLVYTSRMLAETGFEPTPLPTLTPTPIPTGTPTPLPEPEPTPTVSLPPIDNNPDSSFSVGPISSTTSSGGILLGALPAALFVVVVFGIGLYFVKRK